MRHSKSFVATLLVAVSFVASSLSAQETYPSKSITIIVPFAAGSGADIGGRLLAKDLSETLGVAVVVENKAGADGSIATEMIAKSAADGYSLVMVSNSVLLNVKKIPGVMERTVTDEDLSEIRSASPKYSPCDNNPTRSSSPW